MKQDRERMAGLQQELRELQSAMARPPTGGVGVPQMLQSSLPPLGSAAAGADVGSSRVHFLYFLSSFLLLKTALHTQGEMANVGAQEVHAWDVDGRRRLGSYSGHRQGRFVIRSAFGGKHDGLVLSGSEDTQVYVWHRHFGSLLEATEGCHSRR